MILLVTSKRDVTTDLIVQKLQTLRRPYFRLNTEDLPQGTLHGQPGAEWSLSLNGEAFKLSNVTAAYFRRPGMPEIRPSLPVNLQDFVLQEWQSALTGLYWVLEERWLNSPMNIALAENKIRQLILARSMGFTVPDTLIGNSAPAAAEFADSRQCVAKPVKQNLIEGEGGGKVVFTSRIPRFTSENAAEIEASPFILQQEIVKAFDIRVTVVGEKVFATAIDSQGNPDTEVDWRKTSNPTLPHEIYELPSVLVERCTALVRKLGLRYGAIDLVLDNDGKHWFLEINPNGQWGWIEMRTGHPIAAAIVDELEAIGHGH